MYFVGFGDEIDRLNLSLVHIMKQKKDLGVLNSS